MQCGIWRSTGDDRARRTTQFTLRMDPELKAAAEMGAMADRRSLASVIELLLDRLLQAAGLLIYLAERATTEAQAQAASYTLMERHRWLHGFRASDYYVDCHVVGLDEAAVRVV